MIFVMTTELFFKSLPSFSDFSSVSDEKQYHLVPNDWFIVLTDIKGSTQLVQQGRYQDVNYIGAATIISVLNACGNREIPFTFGGDGATLLIHESQLFSVKAALASTIHWAHQEFKIELRASVVPVLNILSAGSELKIAKYQLAPGNCIAMFSGGGLMLAESWLKQKTENSKQWEIVAQAGSEAPLQGLSCRWAPLKNSKGIILTLIIKARSPANNSQVYSEVLKYIQDVSPISSPVQKTKLKAGNILVAAWKEAKSHFSKNKMNGYFKTAALIAVVQIINIFKIKLEKLDFEKYKEDLVLNSDYRKFDEMLRLVLDCTLTEAQQIKELLESLKKRNIIDYGFHESNEALMTCLVHSIENNQHVHFIDGAGGGYTLAAQMMKKSMLAT